MSTLQDMDENSSRFASGLKDYMLFLFQFEKHFENESHDDPIRCDTYWFLSTVSIRRQNIEMYGRLSEIPYFIKYVNRLKFHFGSYFNFDPNTPRFDHLLSLVERYATLIVLFAESSSCPEGYYFSIVTLLDAFQNFVSHYQSESVVDHLRYVLTLFEMKYSTLKSKKIHGYYDYASLLKKYVTCYVLKDMENYKNLKEGMERDLKTLEDYRIQNETMPGFRYLLEFSEEIDMFLIRTDDVGDLKELFNLIDIYVETLLLIHEVYQFVEGQIKHTSMMTSEFHEILTHYNNPEKWESLEDTLSQKYILCMKEKMAKCKNYCNVPDLQKY